MTITKLALAALIAIAAPHVVNAQDYPTKNVTMVIPSAAGASSNDLIGRFLADRLGKEWGKTVIVENRPGGGFSIGASHVVRSAPDGHTMMFSSAAFIQNAAIRNDLPYDAAKDLIPAGIVGSGPFVIIVGNHTIRGNGVADLINTAKSKKLFFATIGPGTGAEFGALMFMKATGTTMTPVPFKGGGDALIEILAGRIDFYVSSVGAALPFKDEGKVKVVGITGPVRAKSMPDVPTLIEQGVKGVDIGTWWGIFLPRGTPAGIVEKVNASIKRVMSSPEAAEYLDKQDATPSLIGVADAGAFVMNELEKWKAFATNN